MENWTEIKINVPVEKVDEAGAIASMTVPYGIYIEDYSNLEAEAMEIAKIDLIDEDLLAKDRSIGIVHIYISPEENPQEAISFIEDRLSAENIEYINKFPVTHTQFQIAALELLLQHGYIELYDVVSG